VIFTEKDCDELIIFLGKLSISASEDRKQCERLMFKLKDETNPYFTVAAQMEKFFTDGSDTIQHALNRAVNLCYGTPIPIPRWSNPKRSDIIKEWEYNTKRKVEQSELPQWIKSKITVRHFDV